jgi:hypothetical protein
MNLLNSKLVIFLAIVSLAGCSSTKEEQRLTTKSIYQNHAKTVDGNLVTAARQSWKVIDSRENRRVDFEDDLRIPNPELRIVYFPKRESDGSIKRGYEAKFAMYERVHYKVGR